MHLPSKISNRLFGIYLLLLPVTVRLHLQSPGLSSKRLLGIPIWYVWPYDFFLGSAYRQYALLRKTALNQRLAWELEPFMSTFVEAVIALKYNHVQGPGV